MLSLPYSHDVFVAVMAGFNADWALAVGALFALAVAAFAWLVRAPDGVKGSHLRLFALLMAASAVMVGATHQLTLMADFNFLAPIYGAAWILHGVAWLWIALRARRMVETDVNARSPVGSGFNNRYRRIGMAIAAFGLFVYPPLVIVLAGGSPASIPLAGSAPNATALVHAGFLLMVFPRPPVVLVILPLAWAVVSAVTALLLEFPFDFTVSAGLLAASAVAVRARFKRAACAAS